MDAKCAWPAFHRQRSFLINEGQKAWNSCHTPWTRAAVMFMTVPLFFSLPPLNAPRPLSGFDTHPRWLPVTQSARSRPSYGKIGDCEQSRVLHFWNYFVVEALASCYRFSVRGKNTARGIVYIWRRENVCHLMQTTIPLTRCIPVQFVVQKTQLVVQDFFVSKHFRRNNAKYLVLNVRASRR